MKQNAVLFLLPNYYEIEIILFKLLMLFPGRVFCTNVKPSPGTNIYVAVTYKAGEESPSDIIRKVSSVAGCEAHILTMLNQNYVIAKSYTDGNETAPVREIAVKNSFSDSVSLFLKEAVKVTHHNYLSFNENCVALFKKTHMTYSGKEIVFEQAELKSAIKP